MMETVQILMVKCGRDKLDLSVLTVMYFISNFYWFLDDSTCYVVRCIKRWWHEIFH